MVSGNHNQHAEFRHAGYTQSLQYQTPIDDSNNEYVYVENDDAAYGLITSQRFEMHEKYLVDNLNQVIEPKSTFLFA